MNTIPFARCPSGLPHVPQPPRTEPAEPARKLVPITASVVHVCRYDNDQVLAAEGVVSIPKHVEEILTETNGLSGGTPTPGCTAIDAAQFFLTFSDGSTTVDVREIGDCGFVTNGKIVAVGKLPWRSHLKRYGTLVADHQVALPTTAGVHASSEQLKGKLAADGLCFWVEPPDHTRTDVIWPEGYVARAQPLRVLDQSLHIVGSVGRDVTLGGTRVHVSAKVLEGIPQTLQRCLPPASCAGDTCTIWIAA